MPDRPHVVYLHAHDMGRFNSAYGFGVRSPAMQRIAEEGVVYRKAYSAAPTCSPSRAALLTGLPANMTGMLGLAHRGWSLTHPERCLPQAFADAGYRTVRAGLQHVRHWNEKTTGVGYSDEQPATSQRGAAVGEHAGTLIREHFEQGDPTPLFLDVGSVDAHLPYTHGTDVEDDPRYLQPPAPLPDTPKVRADLAAYATLVNRFDQTVAAVYQALADAGVLDETILVVTTDHGLALPGMKCNCNDNGLGVTLLVRGPRFEKGVADDQLRSHLDLYPTLVDACGIDRPEHLQLAPPDLRGMSLHDDVGDRVLFGEVTYHAAYEPVRAIRTASHSFVRRFDPRVRTTMPNIDDSGVRDALTAVGLDRRRDAEVALHDLMFDPQEVCNLADDGAHDELRRSMSGQLHALMVAMDDPLLSGAVAPPQGGMVSMHWAATIEEGDATIGPETHD
ncbi:MAG: sulfatase [Planctomycetota bacterium]